MNTLAKKQHGQVAWFEQLPSARLIAVSGVEPVVKYSCLERHTNEAQGSIQSRIAPFASLACQTADNRDKRYCYTISGDPKRGRTRFSKVRFILIHCILIKGPMNCYIMKSADSKRKVFRGSFFVFNPLYFYYIFYCISWHSYCIVHDKVSLNSVLSVWSVKCKQCLPYPDCDSLITFSISIVLCLDKGRSCRIA